MMNNVTLIGRITKDLELRYFTSGKAVSNFTIAIPRDYKNNDGEYDTDFIDIQVTGKVAELTSEYCRKGDLIAVRGRLEKKVWTDKEDKKHYDVYVKGDKIRFLSTKKDKIDKQQEIDYNVDESIDIKESDLPF